LLSLTLDIAIISLDPGQVWFCRRRTNGRRLCQQLHRSPARPASAHAGAESQLPALQHQFPDQKTLAQELIKRGWLTMFQANQIAKGKGQDEAIG